MIELKAESREILGKKVNQLRKSGSIPAVLYGHGIKSVNVTINAKEFGKVFAQAGETTLLDLNVGGKKKKVLIHDYSKDPLTDKITHVDFFEVRMDEKLKTSVPLVFVGEAPAVKVDNGILVRSLQQVEIEALPQDLPKEISVDISSLKTFEDKITVADLKVAGSVKILLDSRETVALVSEPRSDKEMEELDTKPVEEIGEIKVVGEEEKAAKAAEAESQE